MTLIRSAVARLTLVSAIAATTSATAQAKDDNVSARLRQLVIETAKTFKVPGLSVVVRRDGREFTSIDYGEANLELGRPVEASTRFQLASIAKPFTAAAIMKLAERGLLRVDDLASKYVRLPVKGAETITIEQLLSHTSGLKSFDDLGKRYDDVAFRKLSPSDALELLDGQPLLFKPGTGFAYSNTNALVLAMIVEKVSGSPFKVFVRDVLTEPYGLGDITVCDTRELLPERAAGYRKIRDTLYNAPSPDLAAFTGSGALCSTSRSLALWFEKLGSGMVVNPSSLKRMRTPIERRPGQVADYGYGLSIARLDGHTRVFHAGDTPGFTSMISWFPDDRIVISVLANIEFGPADLLSQQIARLLLQLPPLEVRDLELTREQAERYVGDYDFSRYTMRFSYVDGRLYSLPAESPDEENWMPMLYQGDHLFMASGRNVRIRFELGSDGRAQAMSFGNGSEWSKPFGRHHGTESAGSSGR